MSATPIAQLFLTRKASVSKTSVVLANNPGMYRRTLLASQPPPAKSPPMSTTAVETSPITTTAVETSSSSTASVVRPSKPATSVVPSSSSTTSIEKPPMSTAAVETPPMSTTVVVSSSTSTTSVVTSSSSTASAVTPSTSTTTVATTDDPGVGTTTPRTSQSPSTRTSSNSPTSVVFVGNPGVGKSTLLNSLGGQFDNGFSAVGGKTKTVSSQDVELDGRSLRLIDVPGVMESGVDDTISDNLTMLQDALNGPGQKVLFFVIMPKNGRIAPEDFAVMKTLLSNLRRGPKVGLIITQVKKKQMEECKSSVYYHNVMDVLRQTEVDTKFFEQHRWLILKDHEDDFGDEDKRAIRDYVFSFVPQTVKVGSLLASMLQDFLQFIKKLKHLFE